MTISQPNRSLLEEVKNWIKKPHGQYINGQWHFENEKNFPVVNPVTLETLCDVPEASPALINLAVDCAKEEFDKGTFRHLSARKKAEILRSMGQIAREHQEELAIIEALQNGKLFTEAFHDDLPDCADVFDYYAGWTDKLQGDTYPVDHGSLNYSLREPLGVCSLIVPWNFPLLLAMWKIAPALAAGNTVVIKPSEQTPLSLIRWFELIDQKIKLPPGLINLVLGAGEVGAKLCSHQKVAKVSFTGSTAVGKKILTTSHDESLKSLSLELGGKSPNIFFEDTPDLDFAIERSFHLIFSQKGEKCSEPTRFIIHNKIYDQVVNRLVEKAKNYILGNNFDSKSQQGAQNNLTHFKKINEAIIKAEQEGAKCLAGGSGAQAPYQDLKKGLFVVPTIYTDVNPQSSLWQEEIFGPVLAIARFEKEEEAIKLANDTRYGLAAGLWTNSLSRAHRVAEALDAGMIFINKYGMYDFSSPFGGFRQSGFGGKEMGLESMKAFTKLKSVWVKF